MYFDYLVKIPKIKGRIYKQTRKDVTYIHYEYARIYKKEKKYNVPKIKTIGKVRLDNPEMMYPNPNYLKYFLKQKYLKKKRLKKEVHVFVLELI